MNIWIREGDMASQSWAKLFERTPSNVVLYLSWSI
jgi:hypothetical protein